MHFDKINERLVLKDVAEEEIESIVKDVREFCQAIDRPWVTLINDLRTSGQLAETLRCTDGKIQTNANRGRNHFLQIMPAVLDR